MVSLIAAAAQTITQSVRTLCALPDTLLGRLIDRAWARVFAELDARKARERADTLAWFATWQPPTMATPGAAVGTGFCEEEGTKNDVPRTTGHHRARAAGAEPQRL